MHIMFDSVDLSQIPSTANAVAGYVGGAWPTDSHDALRTKFPHAYAISIAVSARERASFLDIENGDASVGSARAWLVAALQAGQERPGVYGSQYTMQQLRFALAGIPRWKYRLWVAAPNGIDYAWKMLSEGFGACQFDWHYIGRNLDASLCKPGFFTPKERPLYLDKK